MATNYSEFRITSTYRRNKIQFIYGIPIISGTTRRKSATDYIKVQVNRNLLPYEPAVGQQWKVNGKNIETQEARNNRLYNDISFTNPDSLEITLPSSDEGFVRFISNEIDHISDEKARNLWSLFGKKIYVLLENEERETLLSAKGLGSTSVESLIEGFKKFTNLKYSNWLAKHKVPLYVQNRLIKYHSELSIDVIKSNPYELSTFGMNFKEVDNLALSVFNIPQEADIRLAAAVAQAIKNLCMQRGHTYINDKKKLSNKISELVGVEFVDKALFAGKKLSTYITFTQIADTYFHHDLLLVETSVARYISKLVCNKTSNWSTEHTKAFNTAIFDLPYELTDKQKDAVKISLYCKISLITGGAGTGKTTVTRTVLRAYHEMGYKITAIALSGRAAMRLHESIGFPTSTIAKFLRQDSLEDFDIEGNELKHVLVIDEASMVDIVSLYRILNHITSNCRLLFVGDPHQLPPISAGLVLSELDKVPHIEKTHLDIVKRQEASSGIPEYSLAIRNGEVPSKLSTGSIEFHETNSNQTVLDLYCSNPENSMIIAATNNTVDSINVELQSILNPDSKPLKFEDSGQFYSYDLRVNDPILFTQNNYEAGFQNGSLGILTSNIQDKTEGILGTVKLIDSGEIINITSAILDSMKLGYSITLHKAQGSQFKNVIVVLDKTPMVDRSWLYTAVTRSEDSLHIVGTKNRFVKAIKSESAFNKRNAHLSWLIDQYIEKSQQKKC